MSNCQVTIPPFFQHKGLFRESPVVKYFEAQSITSDSGGFQRMACLNGSAGALAVDTLSSNTQSAITITAPVILTFGGHQYHVTRDSITGVLSAN